MVFHTIWCLIVTTYLRVFFGQNFFFDGSELKRSSTYHPQTDEQFDVVNRCLETYLCCFSWDKPSRRFQWLAWAEYNYNTSFYMPAGMTPFKIIYGRDPYPSSLMSQIPLLILRLRSIWFSVMTC